MKTIVTTSRRQIHVGIDVHLKSYTVSALCQGVKVASFSTVASPGRLIRTLRQHYPDADLHSAYEAGFSGFNLHRALDAAGIKNIVVNPASIPVDSRSRVKTDKIDSLKIATSLASGLLRGIRVPPKEQECQRELTRTRSQLVENRKAIGNAIKMKLYHHGVFEEGAAPALSEKFLKDLLARKLSFEVEVALKALAECWRAFSKQISELDGHLKDQADCNSAIQRIYASVPGCGIISSRTLANELGDMKQFPNERALFSFVGLTPSEYSSGEKRIQGRITRQGSSRIRHILVEIAWRAIRQDPSLRRRYDRLKITRGGKKAIVAVARNLIGRIRSCFIQGELYRLEAI